MKPAAPGPRARAPRRTGSFPARGARRALLSARSERDTARIRRASPAPLRPLQPGAGPHAMARAYDVRRRTVTKSANPVERVTAATAARLDTSDHSATMPRMARTAPVPNIPAIPGMNPGVFILGGGGGGGGKGGRGGKGNGGNQGGKGKNGGDDAQGGGKRTGDCGQGGLPRSRCRTPKTAPPSSSRGMNTMSAAIWSGTPTRTASRSITYRTTTTASCGIRTTPA